MINSPFFPPDTLPDLPIGPYYPSDISNFVELTRAAQKVVTNCAAGYVLDGGRQSIGVFVWGAFSYMNDKVGPGIGVNGTVEVSGNGTEVGEEFSMGPGESGTLVETS